VAAFDRATDVIVGLTASSFVTLSFDPPMVMFAIQKSADSYSSIVESKAFGVSLLHQSQSGMAAAFSRRGRDKIDNTQFLHGKSLRCPLIPDALAHVECETSQIVMSGDHAIVVGVVEDAQIHGGDPLLYLGGKYGTFAGLPTC
jgi:flavin reductase (DIM6/NTAB) family NADH-FMN oxidoreductase RutF